MLLYYRRVFAKYGAGVFADGTRTYSIEDQSTTVISARPARDDSGPRPPPENVDDDDDDDDAVFTMVRSPASVDTCASYIFLCGMYASGSHDSRIGCEGIAC